MEAKEHGAILYQHQLVESEKNAYLYKFSDVDDQHEKEILRDISHIHFPSLVLLNINDSHLETIEQLHRIYMPLLSKIYLRIFILIHSRQSIDRFE